MSETPDPRAWRRLDELFDAVLGVTPDARDAWIVEHCSDDAERDELRSLLAALAESGSFLDRPVFDPAASDALSPPLVGGEHSSTTGRRVGPYVVLRVLGTGGMGTVYEAEDERSGRRVALKIDTGSRWVDRRSRSRFAREIRSLERFDHPSIARLYESGTTDDGLAWFAMELIDGKPLDAWVREEMPSRGDRLALFQAVCEAVEHAHSQGVLHRDLKPGNVLVPGGSARAPGPPVEVKVVDFGLARTTNRDSILESLQTAPGSVLGTLPYMSPEQALGDLEHVDRRTDVYALGAILCELVTGRVPIEVADVPLPAALRRVAEHPPLRIGDVDPELRGDLEVIVETALAKNPGERYASAAALAADVGRLRAGAPILARRPGPLRRFARVVARHRTSFAALFVVLVALAGTAATTTTMWLRTARAERRAIDERDAALRVEGFLREMLGRADSLSAHLEPTLADVVDHAASRVGGLDETDPAVAARLHRTLGVVLSGLGRLDRALGHLERARALAGEAVDAGLLGDLADVHFQRGDYGAAEALQREVVDRLFREGAGDASVAKAHRQLAGTLRMLGEAEESERLYRSALEVCRREGDVAQLGSTASNLAGLLAERGGVDEAARLYDEAIRSFVLAYGEESVMTVLARSNLAALQVRTGRVEEAAASYRDAWFAARALLGDAHPDAATVRHGYASALAQAGRLDEAETEMRAALDARLASLGRGHPHVASSMGILASILQRKGRIAEAIDLAREALELDLEHRAVDHRLVATRAVRLGNLLLEEGGDEALTEAVDRFGQAERRLGDSPVRDSLRFAALYGRARSRLALGDPVGAEEDLLAGLECAVQDGERAAALSGLIELAPALDRDEARVEAWRIELAELGGGESGEF